MRLYSKDEIIKDIEKLEGATIHLANENMPTCCSNTLYSDVNDRSAKTDTVDELKNKINRYTNKYVIPVFDEVPDSGDLDTMYAGPLESGIFKKIGSLITGDNTSFSKLLDKVPSELKHICIVDSNYCLNGFFKRKFH